MDTKTSDPKGNLVYTKMQAEDFSELSKRNNGFLPFVVDLKTFSWEGLNQKEVTNLLMEDQEDEDQEDEDQEDIEGSTIKMTETSSIPELYVIKVEDKKNNKVTFLVYSAVYLQKVIIVPVDKIQN